MPRFRLLSDHPVDLYHPVDHNDSLAVEAAQVVEVPGDLAKDQPADAYVVGEGDDARAWPKALWELVEDKPAASAAPAVKEK